MIARLLIFSIGLNLGLSRKYSILLVLIEEHDIRISRLLLFFH